MKLKVFALLSAVFSLGLSSCGTQGVRHPVNEYCAGTIEMKSDKTTFDILQLTDIHIGNKDNQKLQLDFLNLTISDAKNKNVDLIVISGDVFTFADKATAYRFFEFLDSYQIPWTLTFGNHDEQCYFSVTWLTDYLNHYGKNCMFIDLQDDDVHGHANFYIDVKAGEETFEKVIIFDSNRYNFGEYIGYDYIKENQIEWYQRVIESSDVSKTKSVAFFHIPLPEFQTAHDLYKSGSSEVIKVNDGELRESCSCPERNTGLFNKMVELGSTNGVFVGHDHVNDVTYLYKGIMLSYGVNSTDRVYFENGIIGGQIISVHPDHSLSIEAIHHSYNEVEGK